MHFIQELPSLSVGPLPKRREWEAQWGSHSKAQEAELGTQLCCVVIEGDHSRLWTGFRSVCHLNGLGAGQRTDPRAQHEESSAPSALISEKSLRKASRAAPLSHGHYAPNVCSQPPRVRHFSCTKHLDLTRTPPRMVPSSLHMWGKVGLKKGKGFAQGHSTSQQQGQDSTQCWLSRWSCPLHSAAASRRYLRDTRVWIWT